MLKGRVSPTLSILFAGLMVVACSSNDDDHMPQMGSMPTETAPADDDSTEMVAAPADDDSTEMVAAPTDGDSMDMLDLGQWAVITVGGADVGYMNTTHGLSAQYDTSGANPTITASSPMHQPTVSGTWTGMWAGRVGPQLDVVDDGPAEVNVTIQGSNVHATLTYNDITGIGNITSDRTSVTDGRFSPSATVTVAGVPLNFAGEGQFGGTDQRGVAGYVGGPGLRSVFYGDRN